MSEEGGREGEGCERGVCGDGRRGGGIGERKGDKEGREKRKEREVSQPQWPLRPVEESSNL